MAVRSVAQMGNPVLLKPAEPIADPTDPAATLGNRRNIPDELQRVPEPLLRVD